MSETLIEAEGLVKAYGHFMAVDGLDLHLNEGEVFGFLGPNGSGKSTTILMLLGLTEPTAGRVEVCGHNPTREPLSVKRQVGYLPESVGFYADLSGIDNLRVLAAYSGGCSEARLDELLDLVRMRDRAGDPVRTYSLGMKQRLGIAQALIGRPRLLLLDEPFFLVIDFAEDDRDSSKGVAVGSRGRNLTWLPPYCECVDLLVVPAMICTTSSELSKGFFKVRTSYESKPSVYTSVFSL